MLKCFSSIYFTQKFQLSANKKSNIQENIIVTANKLCGALIDGKVKIYENSIHAGLTAIEQANKLDTKEADALLTVAYAVVEALEGNKYYQPILTEKEFWPFVFSCDGPTKKDLTVLNEYSKLFVDYNDNKLHPRLTTHGENYKETLKQIAAANDNDVDKEIIKQKEALKQKINPNIVDAIFGGAPDPDKYPEPDDEDKKNEEDNNNKQKQPKSKPPKSPKTEIDTDVEKLTDSNVPNILKNFDTLEIFKRCKSHAYSQKHIGEGLLELGKNKWQIFNRCARIAKKIDANGLLREGTNQIKCKIDNIKIEIRIDIFKGEVRSMNIFREWSNRVMHHAINVKGSF